MAGHRSDAGTTDFGESRVTRVRARDLGDRARGEVAKRSRPPALAPSSRSVRSRRTKRQRAVQRCGRTARPCGSSRTRSSPGTGARARSRYRRLLGTADVLAVALALAVCVPLLGADDVLTPLVAAGIPMIVLLSKVLGLYDRDELLLRKTTLDEVPKLFQVATLTALLLSLGASVFVDGEMGHKQTLGFWLLLSACCRSVAARRARWRAARARGCLLVGEPAAATAPWHKIEDGPGVHARVVAQIDLESAADADDAAAVLALIAEERDVHRVVIAPPATDQGEVLNLIRVAKNLGLKVSVLPRMLEVVGSSVEFDDLEGVNVLGVRRFGLTRSSWLIKRAMDLVVAGSRSSCSSPLFGRSRSRSGSTPAGRCSSASSASAATGACSGCSSSARWSRTPSA